MCRHALKIPPARQTQKGGVLQGSRKQWLHYHAWYPPTLGPFAFTYNICNLQEKIPSS